MGHRDSAQYAVFGVVGAVATSDRLVLPIFTALTEIREWANRARLETFARMPADGFIAGTGTRPGPPTKMCSVSATHSQQAQSTVRRASLD